MNKKTIISLIIAAFAFAIPIIYFKVGLTENVSTSVLEIIKAIDLSGVE